MNDNDTSDNGSSDNEILPSSQSMTNYNLMRRRLPTPKLLSPLLTDDELDAMVKRLRKRLAMSLFFRRYLHESGWIHPDELDE